MSATAEPDLHEAPPRRDASPPPAPDWDGVLKELEGLREDSREWIRLRVDEASWSVERSARQAAARVFLLLFTLGVALFAAWLLLRGASAGFAAGVGAGWAGDALTGALGLVGVGLFGAWHRRDCDRRRLRKLRERHEENGHEK